MKRCCMNVLEICKSYFSGFQDVTLPKNLTANVLGVFKIISYFTIVIPLFFAAVYTATPLCGRVTQSQNLSDADTKTSALAHRNLFTPAPANPSSVVLSSDSEAVTRIKGIIGNPATYTPVIASAAAAIAADMSNPRQYVEDDFRKS